MSGGPLNEMGTEASGVRAEHRRKECVQQIMIIMALLLLSRIR